MHDLVAQSEVSRRIVGTVGSGEEVLDALASLCDAQGVEAGEIRATGLLDSLELSELGPGGGPYRPIAELTGPLTLIHAYGNVSKLGDATVITLRCVVSWNDRGQPRVAGGQVVGARALNLEVVVDSFDDLSIQRRMDPELGLPVFATLESGAVATAPAAKAPAAKAPASNPSPTPASAPRPQTPSEPAAAPKADPKPSDVAPMPQKRPTGWDMVADASRALDEPADDWVEGPDAELRRGDVLLHPKFGRCKVIRVEDDERAVLADDQRKPRTLSLAYVRVRRDLDEDGRVFEVRVGRG